MSDWEDEPVVAPPSKSFRYQSNQQDDWSNDWDDELSNTNSSRQNTGQDAFNSRNRDIPKRDSYQRYPLRRDDSHRDQSWNDRGTVRKNNGSNDRADSRRNNGWNDRPDSFKKNGWNDRQDDRRNTRWNDRQQSGQRNGGWSDKAHNQGNDRRDDRRTDRRYDGPSVTMKVPSKFVGRIIGRGGSKITDLQSTSGARINVTKETDGDQTIVKLSGNEAAIAKAQELILDLTVEQHSYSTNSNPVLVASQPIESTVPEPPKDYSNWQELFALSDAREAAEWAALPPIKKEFYVEHKEITALTHFQVAKFREDNNNIVVERTFKKDDSKPVPKPVNQFYQAFSSYPEILDEIKKAGFVKPSPIQTQAWPVLLNGEDLIGIAQTGTGKTLAFLLPALIHIDGQNTKEVRQGPAALIMAPTRELALQIEREVKKYEYKGITAVCIYGGGNRREQIKIVTEGVDIVIATPGRLNDLVEAGHLNVKYVTYAVLDEADRMLDMGFEPQIRKVMYNIRPTRQTVMTSATWPPGVRRLAQSYMVDPIQVYIGTLDLAATHTVSQIIQMMPDNDEEKFKTFMEFAHTMEPNEKAIVFCGKKARADELCTELILAGVNCQSIHGDRDQSDREQALIDIKAGTVQILIATDVASRGLDIDDITHVINYDFPRNIEEYVHRVGRTGRAGKSGVSISYFTRQDWAQAKELINILQEANQTVPDEIFKMAERFAAWKEKKDASRGRGGGRRW